MKKFMILTLLCTLMGLTRTMAQEAYAVFDRNSKLTFYYDNKSSSRTGEHFPVPLNKLDEVDVQWKTIATRLTTVEFDPSFADARPTNTSDWFSVMLILKTIIGLEYLNTSEVTSMANMFALCRELRSLDLTHFNTAKLKKTSWMFYGCEKLVTICVGDGWTNDVNSNSEYMFIGCHSLVGGNGYKYNDMHHTITKACIDGKDGQTGYFTSAEKVSETYGLWLGGTQVTYMNKDDVFFDGRASYNPDTKTLTFGGIELEGQGNSSDASTGYGCGIYSKISGLTIHMEGGCKGKGATGCNGIRLDGNTTVTGGAYPLAGQGNIGVNVSAGELTVGGDVTLEGDGIGENSIGIMGYMTVRPSMTFYTTLTVKDNATVRARGTVAGIARLANLVLENHAITSPAGAVWNESRHAVCNSEGNPIKERWMFIEYKQPSRADVNGDGSVDSADIVAVIKEMK